jgi:autophagy-related protein 33
MDSSYEVLGHDSNSEGTMSGEEMEEEVNGEEVREQMEGFMTSQIIRTAVAGIGFAMSVIGIWGDGAAENVVIIEM